MKSTHTKCDEIQSEDENHETCPVECLTASQQINERNKSILTIVCWFRKKRWARKVTKNRCSVGFYWWSYLNSVIPFGFIWLVKNVGVIRSRWHLTSSSYDCVLQPTNQNQVQNNVRNKPMRDRNNSNVKTETMETVRTKMSSEIPRYLCQIRRRQRQELQYSSVHSYHPSQIHLDQL